ncbi:DUF2235 domain-containing protein [Mycetocola sp. 2940]|uniref:DUF2235 domain-containing protein n=1 Tax=Mycetocola sp. 2940 TaxID=3156452 RepID=UPI00339A6261
MKRLAVFVDGTWNVPDNNTNVWRLFNLTATEDTDVRQLSYYHVGIGTGSRPGVGAESRQAVSSRLRGAFGAGVNASVRACYEWLVRHHVEGDSVYIFGFSRGAFIARSLVGLIERCGLLLPGTPISVEEVFERYRVESPNGPVVKNPYAARLEWPITTDPRLQRFSHRVQVEMLGVWDAVRYHDVPFGTVRGLSREQNLFHVVHPSTATAKRMFHALAVDEHRYAYRPNILRVSEPESTQPFATFEQRWFPGAHSNIGGGYENDTAALLSLSWMQDNAAKAGLQFKHNVALRADDHTAPIADSFSSFLGGTYSFTRAGRRYSRPIGTDVRPSWEATPDGASNQSIDASVFDRWREIESYRPLNVARWAHTHGVDPARLTDTCIAAAPAQVIDT